MKRIVILGLVMCVIACNQKNKTENTNSINKEKINSLLKIMYNADSEFSLNDTIIFSKEILLALVKGIVP